MHHGIYEIPPFGHVCQTRFLNFIVYSKYKGESFVKQSFLKSFDLYCNGKGSFRSALMEMSEYFNPPDFNTDLLDTGIVKNVVGLK